MILLESRDRSAGWGLPPRRAVHLKRRESSESSSKRKVSAPGAPRGKGWEPPPRRAVPRREVDRACGTRKKLRILLAYELRKQIVTRHGCPLSNDLDNVTFDKTGAIPLDTSVRPLQRVTRIVLCPLYMRVPKRVPLLELFSSSGGTESFLRRKTNFPRVENFFSKAGKFLENSRRVASLRVSLAERRAGIELCGL